MNKPNKALLCLFISLFLSPTCSRLRCDTKDGCEGRRSSAIASHEVAYPAIFSSTAYPKGSELYNLTTRLDILDVKDGRVFYLVVDDASMAEYERFVPETTFERERTKELRELPPPYRSSYSAKNGYPTISDSFDCLRSLEGSFQTIAALESRYPSLVDVVDVGPSYLKTIGEGGHNIKLLKLTNKNSDAETKSHLFVTCALHARELSTAEACARFAEHVLSNYGTDADATWILDHTQIHIVLQSNPDGREDEEFQVSNGVLFFRRKNMNFDPETTTCSAGKGGVDLNRNFPHPQWGTVGVNYNLCHPTYPGTFGASEPEVVAIVDYMKSVLPPGTNTLDDHGAYDVCSSTGVYIDVHSAGEDFFYPWGYKDENPPNHKSFVAMAKKLASHTSPTHSSHNEVYATSGSTMDWAYESLGVAAYAMELGNKFYQECPYFEDHVAPSVVSALMYAARVSKAPYLYSTGPDVMNIALFSNSATDTLQVKVNVSDSVHADEHSTGSQLISEVSLYLNVHPYGGSAEASSIVDSGFVSSTEIVTLSVNVSSLADGQHTIYIRAKDSDGVLGPVYASYFVVPLNYENVDPNDEDSNGNEDNNSGVDGDEDQDSNSDEDEDGNSGGDQDEDEYSNEDEDASSGGDADENSDSSGNSDSTGDENDNNSASDEDQQNEDPIIENEDDVLAELGQLTLLVVTSMLRLLIKFVTMQEEAIDHPAQ